MHYFFQGKYTLEPHTLFYFSFRNDQKVPRAFNFVFYNACSTDFEEKIEGLRTV